MGVQELAKLRVYLFLINNSYEPFFPLPILWTSWSLQHRFPLFPMLFCFAPAFLSRALAFSLDLVFHY
jgi:hypothetical protein